MLLVGRAHAAPRPSEKGAGLQLSRLFGGELSSHWVRFLSCPPPPLQLPGGSQAGLWLMGEGFMAGGDTAGALSLGHSQHHLLRHLPD